MTPEERAREIARLVESHFDFPNEREEFEHAIATAIREARNEALEEAAGVAIAEGYPAWEPDIPEQHKNAWEQCANRIASRIRALKDTKAGK